MYGLTLWRPWGWCVMHGPKDLENRTWPPPPWIIGQRIAIHSGAKWDDEAALYIAKHWGGATHGYRDQGILGTAIVERYFQKWGTPEDQAHDPCPPGQEPWFFGPYAWVLKDKRPLATVIACPGNRKLWKVPPDIAARLEAA